MAIKKTKKKNSLNLYADSDYSTVATRNKYGKFTGRRKTKKGEKSDRTAVWRVKSPETKKGMIFGRTESLPIKVKGSKKKRGTVRKKKKK